LCDEWGGPNKHNFNFDFYPPPIYFPRHPLPKNLRPIGTKVFWCGFTVKLELILAELLINTHERCFLTASGENRSTGVHQKQKKG